LTGLLLALALPLFPISYESPIALMNNSDFFSLSEKPTVMAAGNTLNIHEKDGSSFDLLQLLLGIYLMGIIFFLLRLGWQTFRISWGIRQSKIQIIHGLKIIDHNTEMPFSFFNVVFTDIQKYS